MRGSRPRVVRQRQFLSTYIFGAVCPDRNHGCALVLPECSTGIMKIHLDEISKEVQEGHHAILMMDRASWHTTEALVAPENLSLLPLPPYSPELNPMEQVWQKLKRDHLSKSQPIFIFVSRVRISKYALYAYLRQRFLPLISATIPMSARASKAF